MIIEKQTYKSKGDLQTAIQKTPFRSGSVYLNISQSALTEIAKQTKSLKSYHIIILEK
jgi:hypothetical protein